MTTQRLKTGQQGEELAVEYLLDHGYIIIERNYPSKLGEMDIIANDGGVLCFVEVKTRKNPLEESLLEAITPRKQKKISQVALCYIEERGIEDQDIRFDVVTIDQQESDTKIELLKDAFELTQPYFQ